MCKKALVSILCALLILSSFGCVNKTAVDKQLSKEESIGIYKPEIQYNSPSTNLRLEDVARDLITMYLDQFISKPLDQVDKIKSYKIKEIKIIERNNSGFTYTIKFSLEVPVANSKWVAGNGVVKNNGWIEDKFMFVKVLQNGNSYAMEGWGTGP